MAEDPRKDPSLSPETNRGIWIGFAGEAVSLGLSFLVRGNFFPYVFVFMGIVLGLRGAMPTLFAHHIDEQIILGTPYRRTESARVWCIAWALVLSISALATWIHPTIFPGTPDIAVIVKSAIADGFKQHEPDQDSRHIQAQLVIDSVRDGVISEYHLSVENIGSASITRVGVIYAASPVRPIGGIPLSVAATLPPRGGRVSVPGVDAAELSKRRQMYAIFNFKVDVGGTTKDVISSHRFILPADLAGGRSLDPRTFYEFTGDIRQGMTGAAQNDVAVMLADALAISPVGTIEFWASEKDPGGRPNYVSMRTSRLSVFYDPTKRSASIIPAVTGKALTISFDMKPKHYVVFAWDLAGPRLVSVDGRSVTNK